MKSRLADRAGPTKPRHPDDKQRFSLACVSALTMYACSAGYGGYYVFHNYDQPALYIGLILGVPAIGALLFVLASLVAPNLLAPGRLTFPLNLTLPPVFSAFVVLTVLLLSSTGNSIIMPYDRIRAAMFWTSPPNLVVVIFSQIVCLSALAKLKGEPVD